jgi:hypothetical protein
MKSTICLLFLLALLKANDFEFLTQMADLEFGKTVIETIQIELSGGE